MEAEADPLSGRCVLLPLGKSYEMIERTSTIVSQGIFLVRIHHNCLSFKAQEGYFSSNFVK